MENTKENKIEYRIIYGKEPLMGCMFKVQKSVKIFGFHLFWTTLSLSCTKDSAENTLDNLLKHGKHAN